MQVVTLSLSKCEEELPRSCFDKLSMTRVADEERNKKQDPNKLKIENYKLKTVLRDVFLGGEGLLRSCFDKLRMTRNE